MTDDDVAIIIDILEKTVVLKAFWIESKFSRLQWLCLKHAIYL